MTTLSAVTFENDVYLSTLYEFRSPFTTQVFIIIISGYVSKCPLRTPVSS